MDKFFHNMASANYPWYKLFKVDLSTRRYPLLDMTEMAMGVRTPRGRARLT